MSNDATKKRRVGDCDNKLDSGDTASLPMDVVSEPKDSSTTLATIMAEIKGIRNRMDEMETSKQNEIDSMKSRISQMEDQNESLQVKCDSLERSLAILVKEQEWEYSVPDIPRSHWIQAGFDNDDDDDAYIECMEKFMKHIKMYTCKLRNGDGDMSIYLGEDFINYDRVLLHDDVLLPHWKEFANALQLYQTLNSSSLFIDYLDFYNVQLAPSVLGLLLPALRRNRVKKIILENNDFANVHEGIEFAVEVINGNQHLKGLNWVNNQINNMEDAQLLIDAVSSHLSIDEFCLDSCFGGDGVNGYDILQSILSECKNFSTISVNRNNIRTGGGTTISDFIAKNPPLKELSLENNNLNDDDAVLISRALKHNTNLKRLNLCGNNFTEIGFDALQNAVNDTTSLNTVSDSNHTCYIEGIDSGDILGNVDLHSDSGYTASVYSHTARYNRRRKLYHLLSVRNRDGTNLHHLNLEFGDDDDHDDSIKLVPKVLESVSHYSREQEGNTAWVSPLSIMFEVLRSWKMPELYERR